jgi:secretory lipase
MWRVAAAAGALLAVVIGLTVSARPGAAAVAPPSADPFYRYTASTPLASISPGTILKTRTLKYHLAGLSLPLAVTQLLFRSTDETGAPDVAVTSVAHAPGHASVAKAVSYQSFYDSLNPADEPSYAIEGGRSFGGVIPNVEMPLFGAFLTAGYSIIIPDTEGENADFAAGPEYGMVTLDSIRAAINSPDTGLEPATQVAMIGYSGGAIATGWAAVLAPTYAPDVNHRLVGAAEGGILADPAHNLHYINGTPIWSGVLPMAIIGIARANHVDLSPYMSDYARRLLPKFQDASIAQVLGSHPGLTWQKLALPAYPEPEDLPTYVTLANKLDMGLQPAPTIPMFMGQGAGGALEGSPPVPGIGPGDGVMVAGDVRALARQWCAAGTPVQYQQYDLTSHITSVVAWLPAAIAWVEKRFAGKPVPNNCAHIRPGNSLAPIG